MRIAKDSSKNRKIALFRHRPRAPTDKDWLALRTSQAWIEVGLSLHNLLKRAVSIVCTEEAAGTADRHIRQHEIETHPEGRRLIQGNRIRDSRDHFSDENTHLMNRLLLVSSEDSQSLLYGFLGNPDIHKVLDPDDGILPLCLNAQAELIDSWSSGNGGRWSVLHDLRPDFQRSPDLIRAARKFTCTLHSSFIKSFCDECYGIDLLSLFPLISGKSSRLEQMVTAREFIQRRCCHFKLGGKNVVDLAQSRADVLTSPPIVAVVKAAIDQVNHGGREPRN